MIRRRQVYPDATGVVTREALLEAMIDAATFLDFAGGVLSVVTQRQSTGLPGEMVTVGAIVEWRHDARVEPKPQQFEAPTAAPERSMVDVIRNGEQVAMASVETADSGYPISETAEPDGFDYSKLDEEDVEEPVAAS